jgi:hypothetical protein
MRIFEPIVSGSLIVTGGITGSLQGTASFATTSSVANTAVTLDTTISQVGRTYYPVFVDELTANPSPFDTKNRTLRTDSNLFTYSPTGNLLTVTSSFALTASYVSGSGVDTNFANTNLTFTSSRAHNTDGNAFELTTDGGGYTEGFIYLDSEEYYAGIGRAYAYSFGGTYSIYNDNFAIVEVTDNKTFKSNFGFQKSFLSITSAFTLDAQYHVVNCPANTFTITLPAASIGPGREYIIKNSGTGIITVAASGSQRIDGAATQSLNQLDAITIVSTSTNWIITSKV